MLREKLGLAAHQLGRMGFERFRDLRVQLLPSAAQQAVVRDVLHQRVFEGIERVGRLAPLEHQLRGDQPVESSLQFVLGRCETARRSLYENSRPIAAPVCATRLTDSKRSSRAISESCKVV